MVLRARLQFFAHRKETLAVHLSPVPNLNGVWGAMEQKVHLSPVPVLKPACCLDSTIKPPFYETALTNIRKDRKHPKSGSINSFRQSEFSNQQSHTSKANSNSCLRWFSVPLLPKPQARRVLALRASILTPSPVPGCALRLHQVNVPHSLYRYREKADSPGDATARVLDLRTTQEITLQLSTARARNLPARG